MKNLSLALNIILLIAVTFLFIKVYSDKPVSVSNTVPSDAKIVYVNTDSLMDNYSLYNSMKEILIKKRDSIDLMLQARGMKLEKDIQNYQEAAGNMSAFERQTKEEALMKRQQELMSSRDEILDQLGAEESVMNDSIHNDLVGFLREYNRTAGFDLILGYQRGGAILLGSDSLDITKAVIEGINAKK